MELKKKRLQNIRKNISTTTTSQNTNSISNLKEKIHKELIKEINNTPNIPDQTIAKPLIKPNETNLHTTKKPSQT